MDVDCAVLFLRNDDGVPHVDVDCCRSSCGCRLCSALPQERRRRSSCGCRLCSALPQDVLQSSAQLKVHYQFIWNQEKISVAKFTEF